MNDKTSVRAGASYCRRILLTSFLAAVTTAGSCNNSETLFQSNFDTTGFDQPPSATQAVGTAEIAGASGSVLVAAAPPDAAPPAKWLRIFRPNDPSQISVFRGKLSRAPGNGTYVFSCALVIPDGNTGPASIQFETFNLPASGGGFLHLDFMPQGNVRIDDDVNTTFGSFERNQVFLVQVTLNINDSSPNAHIVLSGAGASGETDRVIIPALRPQAQQFGAVRLFMGFPHLGEFHATNVVVSRRS